MTRSQANAPKISWAEVFLILCIACQFALLNETLARHRVIFRALPFLASLFYLVRFQGARIAHPATRSAQVCLAIVILSFFNPNTNSVLSGMAQVAMYFAILAPLFWASCVGVSSELLNRLILLIWIFHSVSALFGVLQTHYPGRFQPAMSTVMQEQEEAYYITLASGERVFRPMGLTDTPGGAAGSGFYAMLFGAGMMLTHRNRHLRVLAIGSMFLGLYCLYLGQVRSLVVMAAICMLVIAAVFFLRGQFSKFAFLSAVLCVAAFGAFSWAVSIGGEAVTGRLATLVENNPGVVYYENRGQFLEKTIFDLLPQYPLGAGLGRWGMMHAYFGNKSASAPRAIWAEIQWTGWLLDGGVPLVLAFTSTIFLALSVSWRIALLRGIGDLWIWAIIIFSYNIGALALCFNYTFFQSQGAMELWLLNGALYAVTVKTLRTRKVQVLKTAQVIGPRASAQIA